MEKLSSILLCTLLLIIIFTSCEYEPTGTNYVEVDSIPSAPVFDVQFNWDNDTVVMNGNEPIYFTYDFKGLNKEFIKASLYIDTIHIGESEERKKYYYYHHKSDNQIDTLNVTLEIYTSSGTLSLADKLGTEIIYVKKEWVLILINMQNYELPGINVTELDGKIKITWEIPPVDISHYTITKSVSENGSNSKGIGMIFSKDTNWFYDDSYVGEKALYRVAFQDNYNQRYYYPRDSIEKSFDLSFEKVNSSTVILNWNECRYPENFSHYLLDDNNYQTENIKIDNVKDTNIVLDSNLIGSQVKWTLQIIPETDYHFNRNENNSSTINYFTGSPSFGFEYIASVGYDKILYADNYHHFFSYDVINDVRLDSTYFHNATIFKFAVSQNGEFVVINKRKSILISNIYDLDDYREISLNELTNNEYPDAVTKNSIDGFSVSDNGILSFRFYNRIFIYDLMQSEYKYSFSVEQINVNFVFISSDAQFCVQKDYRSIYIYKLNDFSAELIHHVSDVEYFQFVPNVPDQIIYQEWDNNITVFDLKTLTTIRNLGNDEEIVSCDFHNQKLLTVQRKGLSKLKIYDTNTWELLWSKPGYPTPYRTLFKNNILYTGDKNKYTLD